jgi:hypothetical protein
MAPLCAWLIALRLPPAADAVASAHSAELSAAQAALALAQLRAYVDRFSSRLAAGALCCAGGDRQGQGNGTAVKGMGWGHKLHRGWLGREHARGACAAARAAAGHAHAQGAPCGRTPVHTACQRALPASLPAWPAALRAGNCRNIQTLVRVAAALWAAAGPQQQPPGAGAATPNAGHSGSSSGSGGSVLTVNEFLLSTGLDNVNMFKLCRWVGGRPLASPSPLSSPARAHPHDSRSQSKAAARV